MTHKLNPQSIQVGPWWADLSQFDPCDVPMWPWWYPNRMINNKDIPTNDHLMKENASRGDSHPVGYRENRPNLVHCIPATCRNIWVIFTETNVNRFVWNCWHQNILFRMLRNSKNVEGPMRALADVQKAGSCGWHKLLKLVEVNKQTNKHWNWENKSDQ